MGGEQSRQSRQKTQEPNTQEPNTGLTVTGIRKADNPWFHTAMLVNHQGGAPDVSSINGRLFVIENADSRKIIEHQTVTLMFKGRRNGQVYKTT